MKYIIFVLLTIFLNSCNSKQLILLKSSSQTWSTTDKNISGTNYHFLLKTLANKNELQIDSLCVKNKLITNFHYSVIGKSNTYTNYIKEDSIIISINEPNIKTTNNKTCACLKNYASCIYYTYKNKNYQLNVDSIIILQNLK